MNDGVAVGEDDEEPEVLEIRDSNNDEDDVIDRVAVGEGVGELVTLEVSEPDDDTLSP